MSDDQFTEDVGDVRFTNPYIGAVLPDQADLFPASLKPLDIQVVVTVNGEVDDALSGQVARELHDRMRTDWRNRGRAEIVGEVAESLENNDWPMLVPDHGPSYLKSEVAE